MNNGTTSSVDKSNQTRELILRLWQRSLPVIHERLNLLDAAATAAQAEAFSIELRAQAICEAHKLAGSLGMFGYPQGSVLAREIEQLLEIDGHLEPTQLTRLATELRTTLFPPGL
jgi:HPt (histidine-containing phosphotransfer) domain-containing protein